MHTYQLSLDAGHTEVRSADINSPVLLVSLAQAKPGFETPRMVYFKRLYELEHYAINQWADTPARMFTALLVQALGQTGAWRSVIPLPGSVRGDYRLDSHGFTLQQEFMQRPSRVRVVVRTQLVDLKEFKVVGTRAFEATEETPSEDAYGGVLAANRAIVTILDHIVSWLQQCVRHPAECDR
jgi:cholesterol transport system auxiliary component